MLLIAKTTIMISWLLALTVAARAATTEPSVPFLLSPQTTSITAPLRPDGTVDYVAAINQHFSEGVTPQNNGFVLWLRVMGYGGLPRSTGKAMAQMCGAEDLTPADAGFTPYSRNTPIERGDPHLWKESDDPAYAAFLKSNEDMFAVVTQAAAKPRWWEPSVSENGSMLMILLPELNLMRAVSLDLCNRALLRAQRGDFDGFLSDVITVKRLGRGADCGFLVGNLVSNGIDVLVDRAISAAAGAGIFSSDECANSPPLSIPLNLLPWSGKPWISANAGAGSTGLNPLQRGTSIDYPRAAAKMVTAGFGFSNRWTEIPWTGTPFYSRSTVPTTRSRRSSKYRPPKTGKLPGAISTENSPW